MRALAVLGVLVGAASVGHAAGFNFTFTAGNEGWTKGNFGNGFANIDNDVAGTANWNAAGYLTGTDHGDYAFLFSPNLGGGHGALFGEDLNLSFQTAAAQGDIPFVVLVSSAAFLVLEQPVPASATQNPYTINLSSAAGWAYNSSNYYGTAVLATDAQIQAVLSDLRYVGVTTDLANGGDATQLDNVAALAAPVPEPGTLAALGLGIAALRRRRRK